MVALRTLEGGFEMDANPYVIDKSRWGNGPWQDEPDVAEWTDERTGLPCVALRTKSMGHWCGYVGVAEGHPLYNKSYDDSDIFDVHGGLTFCGSSLDDRVAPSVTGGSGGWWWLGFDCAHSSDLVPAWSIGEWGRIVRTSLMDGEYRDLAYVKRHCKNLAAQLEKLSYEESKTQKDDQGATAEGANEKDGQGV